MAGGEAGAFGALLRRYRRAAALSQEALAERAGLSAVAVSALERGTRRAPYLGTVEQLADALKLAAPDRAALLAAARPQASDHGGVAAGDGLVPLAGRARELALLEAFLAGVGGPLGAARVLLLAGEPGIGKTRLLQAAAQRAAARGWAVLAGGCQRRGQEPYAPLLDALAQHLQALGPPQRRAALAGCAWLVRMLPELAGDLEPLPPWVLPPAQERRLIHAAVARLLANVAGPAETLLLLDDLHWAGPDALDLIDSLARTAGPVRIVGAYRDTEVRPDDPLGLLLSDLAQARLARQHPLGPLAEEEAAALLEDLLVDVPAGDRGAVEGALRRAGGTPFYLVSYAQALRQGGADGVPWDVAQGVRQRAALLPPAGKELLGVAAVVGRRAPRALLVAVAGQPEEAVLAGLEAACRARLLLEEGEDSYAFAHDLIREVVEAELGAARRAALHRRVAEALEDDPWGASPELLAYHYARGDVPAKAALFLEQAGDHAWSQHAHSAASSHYRDALERLEALGRVQDAARVREKLGEALIQAGSYDAALRVLGQAAETYVLAGDSDGQGRVAARMGEAHAQGGSPDAGIALLHRVLQSLDPSSPCPSLAAVHLILGMLLWVVGRYEESLAASARATELARAGGDAHTLVFAELYVANNFQMLGRIEEALRVDREVLTLAEAGGELKCLLSVNRDLAYFHALRGEFAIGRRHIERSFALSEQLGNAADFSYTLAVRGWLASLSGNTPAAQADLDRAVALRRQTDRSWYSTYVLIFQARLSLVAGDLAVATAAAHEAIAQAEGSSDLQAHRWAAATMAEIEILRGRPEAARARLAPLLDRPGIQECDVTTFLPVLAWAQLELGQVQQAAGTLDQALARARPEGMRLVLVQALTVQALVALRRERWGVAARCLEEGLALARAMPYPYAEARLLEIGGSLHTQDGEPEAARDRLMEAQAIFARLGARLELTRVERMLTTLSQNGGPRGFETVVSDAQWAQIQALLPPPAHAGRRRADDRRTLEAILYRERTGRAWAALPTAYGDGATAHRRLREWQATGVWERIAAIVHQPSGQGRDERPADPGAAGSALKRSGNPQPPVGP